MKYKDRKRWLEYAARLDQEGHTELAQLIKDMIVKANRNSNSKVVQGLRREWEMRQKNLKDYLPEESHDKKAHVNRSTTFSAEKKYSDINSPIENTDIKKTDLTSEFDQNMICLLGEELFFLVLGMKDSQFQHAYDLGMLFLQRYQQQPLDNNCQKIQFQFDSLFLPEMGRFIWKYKHKLNTRWRGLYEIDKITTQPEDKEYIQLGFNFVNCFAQEHPAVACVYNALIMARVLEGMLEMMKSAKPNEPIITYVQDESEEMQMIRLLLTKENMKFGLPTNIISFVTREGPTLSSAEIELFKNINQGVSLPSSLPVTVKEHLSKQDYSAACYAMMNNQAIEIKPLCDYLMCLVQRYDAINKQFKNADQIQKSAMKP